MLTHTKHIPVKPIDTQTDDINIRILNELERESLPYVKNVTIHFANAVPLS